MPPTAEERTASQRAHYQANKEYYKENARKARAANPGRNAYYQTSAWAAHRAEKAEWERERRDLLEKLAQQEPRKGTTRVSLRRPIPAGVRADVLSIGCCQYCGHGPKHGVTLHVDHIKPVSKGGTNDRSNLQALCELCNLGKSASYKPPI
jgi:5-methylcytosine-specific restriction endonuclease McrA